MNDTDLCYLSAHETNDLITSGELSPVEFTRSLLERIEDLNPRINAFLTVTPERALAEAQVAEDRALRGERIGPLDGVPHSIKDQEPTRGIRTTSGSLWNHDHVPENDSLVVERMQAAGSPLLGKTNTPNAGYKDMTDNLLGPPARNPWDLTRTPGGSSGGAAAAVSAGLGALAQGSDGAGSIRIPASFTGLVGFKPSSGLIPKWPDNNWYGWSQGTKGPITRTVLDTALMLNALAGADRRDPFSIDPAVDFVEATKLSVKGLKVAWSPDFGHLKVAPDVADACASAAKAFGELGCDVTEVPITWGTLSTQVSVPTFNIHFVGLFAEQAQEHPEWIEPSLMELIQDGHTHRALDYERLLAQRAELYDQVRRLFDEYDLLLSPTMPDTAWAVDGEPDMPLFDRMGFTSPFNLTGHPAVSVPCGLDRHSRPIGLQIVAGWRRDDLALAAASRFEEARPWPTTPGGI